MTDAELIARLRSADLYNAQHYERDPLHKQAADRIEALTVESARRLALARSEGVARVEQFERTEALTEQLAAARHDAKEAEAYAEEVEREQKGWQEAAVKLMNKLTTSEAKLAECEARLRKAVEALEDIKRYSSCGDTRRKAIETLAEIKGGNDAKSDL